MGPWVGNAHLSEMFAIIFCLSFFLGGVICLFLFFILFIVLIQLCMWELLATNKSLNIFTRTDREHCGKVLSWHAPAKGRKKGSGSWQLIPFSTSAVLLYPACAECLGQKSQVVVSQPPGMTRCCKDTELTCCLFHVWGVWSLNLSQPTTFWKQTTPSGLFWYFALSRLLSAFSGNARGLGRDTYAGRHIVRTRLGSKWLLSQGHLESLSLYVWLEDF